MLFPCIVLLSLGVVSSDHESLEDHETTTPFVTTTTTTDIENTFSINNDTTTTTTTTTSSSENFGNATTSKIATKIIFSVF